MVDGDCHGAAPIHLSHFAEEVRSMIRPPLQDVVLPLMNHFMRQRIYDFLFTILARLDDLLEQGKGEANFSLGRKAGTLLAPPWPRPSMTHEQTD